MDGVASAFAVVSLALQLVETGEKISKFLKSVQDTPNEIIRLGQTLDQLNGTLKQIGFLLEQQYLIRRLPGSPIFVTKALENCEKTIKRLEGVIEKAKRNMTHQNRMYRSWATIRFVSKKEDVREMQNQLRDAEIGLQTAILSNSWQLQMHSVGDSCSGATQTTTNENSIRSVSPQQGEGNPSFALRSSFRTTTEMTNYVWYLGFFGRIDIRSKSTSLSMSNVRRLRNRVTSEEEIVRITPMFFRRTFELVFVKSFGQISRSLRTYTILERKAPIFEICERGDLQGLQVALTRGTVSPFVSDEYDKSLLHYAALGKSAEMCAFLLQIGVDSNSIDFWGRKALAYTVLGSFVPETDTIDTLKLLTKSQGNISSRDLYEFWAWYQGPVQIAEFMSSNSLVQFESDFSDGEDIFPLLAATLRQFGGDPTQWENFLRLLLRRRVGLHSPVSRYSRWIGSMYPCKALEFGTPLDELFLMTKTPFEGAVAAHCWLQVLSSEGYDIKAYLEEESALHAEQMQLTIPSKVNYRFYYGIPRQLLFHWDSNPSVSWDWWIDPESSTYLVREEFKHMDILTHDVYLKLNEWRDTWPLIYPKWYQWSHYDEDDSPDVVELRFDRAQERAHRRLRKKSMKAARALGLKKRERMPGAWPV